MDMRKLEQLEQFAAFIEFLSHPEQYTDVIAEAKAASAEYQKVIIEERKIKDFEAWKLSQMQELDTRQKAFDARVKQFEVTKSTAEKALADKDHSLNKKHVELNQKYADHAVREENVSDLEDQKAQLAKDQAALNENVKQLFQDRAALDAKKQALSSILGGK